MLRRFGRYLGNNLLGLLALVVAISGTAYAAATIGSAEIIDDSVRSVDIKDGNVRGADIVDEAVTSTDLKNGTVRAVDLAEVPWRVVAPSTGVDGCDTAVGEFCQELNAVWQNHLDGLQVARFRKDATAQVHLEGVVTEIGDEAGLTDRQIFGLPEGYRPAATQLLTVACGDGSSDQHGVIEVRPTGEVMFRATATLCKSYEYVSLSGVSFYAG